MCSSVVVVPEFQRAALRPEAAAPPTVAGIVAASSSTFARFPLSNETNTPWVYRGPQIQNSG